MDSTILFLVYLLLLLIEESNQLSKFRSERTDNGNFRSYVRSQPSAGKAQSQRNDSNCNSSRSLCNTVQHLSSIYATLRDVASRHPLTTKLRMIGQSYRNRPIYSLEIFRRRDIEDVTTVVVEFGAHGREWASTGSAMFTIHRLLDDGDLIKDVRWFIIPVLNPDGYYYATTKDNMWAKNRRPLAKKPCVGVDVNRNFDVAWDLNLEMDPCNEYYGGPRPFSELESRALRDFIDGLEPYSVNAFLSVHSCGQAILYPYGYTDKELSPWKLERLQQAGRVMAKQMKQLRNRNYDVDVAYKNGGFRGSSADYIFDYFHIPYVFTLELGNRIFFDEYNFHHCYHPPSSAEMEYLNKECYAGLVALAIHVKRSFVSETERRLPAFFNSLPSINHPPVELVFCVILIHLLMKHY